MESGPCFLDWLSHVRALEFFQGSPALVVPDNLKNAVVRPCRYEISYAARSSVSPQATGCNSHFFWSSYHSGCAGIKLRSRLW